MVRASLAEGPRPVSSIEAAVKLTGEAKEAFVGQLQFGNGKEVEDNAMREAMKAAEAGLVEMDLKVSDELLEQAFERSRRVTAEYAKTFYLGAILIPTRPPRTPAGSPSMLEISTPFLSPSPHCAAWALAACEFVISIQADPRCSPALLISRLRGPEWARAGGVAVLFSRRGCTECTGPA